MRNHPSIIEEVNILFKVHQIRTKSEVALVTMVTKKTL